MTMFRKSLMLGAAVALASSVAFAQVSPTGSAAPGAVMENAAPNTVNPPMQDSAMGGQAQATQPQGGAMNGGKHHEWTLDEARKHAHERADQLDKMTPAQWAAEEKAHHDKWASMTPEQRQALKAMRHGNNPSSGSPSTTTTTTAPAQ